VSWGCEIVIKSLSNELDFGELGEYFGLCELVGGS